LADGTTSETTEESGKNFISLAVRADGNGVVRRNVGSGCER